MVTMEFDASIAVYDGVEYLIHIRFLYFLLRSKFPGIPLSNCNGSLLLEGHELILAPDELTMRIILFATGLHTGYRVIAVTTDSMTKHSAYVIWWSPYIW